MSGILAQGTTLKIGDGATPTEVFTTIAGVTSFSGPSSTRTVINSTDLSSTAQEFLLGLKDNGEVSFDINYTPDTLTHATLEDKHDNAALTNYQIVYSSGAKIAFAAYVTALSPEGAQDSLLTAKVTLKVSGSITRTPAV